MSNDSQEISESAETEDEFPVWLPIAAGVAALAFAAWVLSLICGPLSGLLMPPSPPLPPGAELVETESDGYGVDSRLYTIDADPCEVMEFYRSEGANCSVTPGVCSAGGALVAEGRSVNVGHCIGTGRFAIFAWRYEAWIGGRVDGERPMASLRMFWEINWLGGGNPSDAGD